MSKDRASSGVKAGSGICSEQGARPDNQDVAAVWEARAATAVPVLVGVVADGVGGAKGGRVAAELAVRGVLEAIDGSDPARGVQQAATAGLAAANGWIHAVGKTDPALEGMATTLTALLLCGRQAHVLHVGDSRAYRLRDGRLARLTTDHAGTGARRHMLTRAIGAADSVQIDHVREEARVGDRYLLCSDGVHGGLRDAALAEVLAAGGSAEDAAARLVAAALAARIGDNATAVVLDILALPAADQLDLEQESATLPILPLPHPGALIDGYRLHAMLADGRYSRVFRASDTADGREVIVKFPKPIAGAEAVLRQAFLRESWIAARIRSPFVGESIDPGTRRSGMYVVMPFYAGETLEQLLSRPPPVRLAAGVAVALQLAKAVAALHRCGIIHRDIKPENIILTPTGVRLVDLGVARLPFLEDAAQAEPPGTPSYKAPELFAGAAGDAKSDIFALAVTVYRMFTQRYPFGEIEPFARPRLGLARPLVAHRPDLPVWLDTLLGRMLAARPEDRPDAIEFSFELEHGLMRAADSAPVRHAWYARDPLRFWQIVACLLAAGLLASLL